MFIATAKRLRVLRSSDLNASSVSTTGNAQHAFSTYLKLIHLAYCRSLLLAATSGGEPEEGSGRVLSHLFREKCMSLSIGMFSTLFAS